MPDPHALAANRTLLRALAARRPSSVPEVVDVLAAIAEAAAELTPREDGDGIACFTRLYHRITQDVLTAAEAGEFRCPGDFILELDVAFARRYLDALRDHLDGGSDAPACWELLFRRRQEPEVARWRYAVVGVNAHVNFDLAFALLDVWEDHPEEPLGSEEEQYADYVAINDVFHRAMDELIEQNDVFWTRWFSDGGLVDQGGNLVGDLLVTGTRALAWTAAERMWHDRGREGYRVGPTAFLDAAATGVAGLFL